MATTADPAVDHGPPAVRLRSRLRSAYEPPAVRLRAACGPPVVRLWAAYEPPTSRLRAETTTADGPGSSEPSATAA
ncbi:hypothetical protein [Actinoplanes rectilineatus]|uniref:hypothetical protein n=1 Tax=Actinoplanes rectilineatus TaxID=113571 RepID=UPI000A9ECA66|nr:hypothetical protein [Actinoplanes rectilineatus]